MTVATNHLIRCHVSRVTRQLCSLVGIIIIISVTAVYTFTTALLLQTDTHNCIWWNDSETSLKYSVHYYWLKAFKHISSLSKVLHGWNIKLPVLQKHWEFKSLLSVFIFLKNILGPKSVNFLLLNILVCFLLVSIVLQYLY